MTFVSSTAGQIIKELSNYKGEKRIDKKVIKMGKKRQDLTKRLVIPVRHVQILVMYSNHLGRIMPSNGLQVTFEHKQR